jgi:hypothetical protein
MIIERHAVYSCEWDDRDGLGRIDLLHGLDPRHHEFSPELYSRFKYGSISACRHFALEIYLAFRHILSNDDIDADRYGVIMTSSACKCMPAASTALFDDVLSLVNRDRMSRNIDAVDCIKIHRRSVLNTDYALMTRESSMHAMEATILDIDASNLRGKHLAVLDDCIITGAHLDNITRHLRDSGVARISYLSIISVKSTNDDGPPHRTSTTSAEDYLNHNHVNSIDRWLEMMNDTNDAGPLTARSLKYFLTSRECREKKVGILALLRHETLLEMHRGAIADDMYSSFVDLMVDIEKQLASNEIEWGDRFMRRVSDADDMEAFANEGDVVYHSSASESDDDSDANGVIEVNVNDTRDESSSKRGHLRTPPPPPSSMMARPSIQRSKSSRIHRSIPVLGVRRQSSDSLLINVAPSLTVV